MELETPHKHAASASRITCGLQDTLTVPRVQSGLHSKGYKGGIYSDQEIRIRHFFAEYFKYLDD